MADCSATNPQAQLRQWPSMSMLPSLFRGLKAWVTPRPPPDPVSLFSPTTSSHGVRIFIQPFSLPAQGHGRQGPCRGVSRPSPQLKLGSVLMCWLCFCRIPSRRTRLLFSPRPGARTASAPRACSPPNFLKRRPKSWSAPIHLPSHPAMLLIVPRLPFRLDELQEGDAIQDYLREKTGQRTVPNIFISK